MGAPERPPRRASNRSAPASCPSVLWLILAALLVVLLIGLPVIRRRRTAPRFPPGEEPGFFFEVRDVLALCCLTARDLASRGDTWLMVEGTFDGLDLEGIETQSEPPEGSTRHTTWSSPREQTVCLQLRPETMAVVCDRLFPSVVDRASHVQMAQHGRLVFGAYDWFESPGCLMTWPLSSASLREKERSRIQSGPRGVETLVAPPELRRPRLAKICAPISAHRSSALRAIWRGRPALAAGARPATPKDNGAAPPLSCVASIDPLEDVSCQVRRRRASKRRGAEPGRSATAPIATPVPSGASRRRRYTSSRRRRILSAAATRPIRVAERCGVRSASTLSTCA